MARDDEFPNRPVPAVGAIAFRDGAVLLVKRGAVPDAGRWSLPGGLLEIGETVEAAAARETFEETQVRVRPVRVFEVRDFIVLEGTRIRWHYLLIDVLCECVAGEPFPGTDAENARFVPLTELGEYDIVHTAFEVLQRASADRETSPPRPVAGLARRPSLMSVSATSVRSISNPRPLRHGSGSSWVDAWEFSMPLQTWLGAQRKSLKAPRKVDARDASPPRPQHL